MPARDDGERADPPWVPVPGMSTAEQAEMFGSIAMSSPAGVVASDLRGDIVWVNPVAERMFGWRREQLLGRPFTMLLPEPERLRILEVRQQILRGEVTDPFLTRCLRRDGRVFDVEATPGVRRDADARPLGTNMLLRDVSEELRVQRTLAQALARSRARFDQSAKPQALLDLEGRFVEVNDAACALLGWTRPELVGRFATEVIHPSDPDLVRDRLRRLRDGELRSATYDTVGMHRDGSRVPLQIDITAVRDEEGRPSEFAAFARDLTELREAQARLRSREAFFRGLNREASDVTLVLGTDGTLVYATPSARQVLGYEPAELVDQLGLSLGHPEDLSRIAAARLRLRTPGARERFAVRLREPDGGWHWFEATVTNCVDDPDIGGVVVNLRDTAAETAAQEALRESEARYRAVVETAQEGIIAIAPGGQILFANERLTEILDLTLEEVDVHRRQGLFYAGEGGELTRRLVEEPPAGGLTTYDLEYRHPRGGATRILAVSASALCTSDGRPLGTLAMVSDVTEQRSAEARLRHQALHDPLTGLPNRVLFSDRLAMARARRARSEGKGGLAVLFLDLDGFKEVNDTHGHETGDRVLVEVAARVAGSVRATDTVARIGGDEFAVVCEDADADHALEVAARIQRSLAAPVEVGSATLTVQASVGVALSPPSDVHDLLRLADRAMYRAKLSRGCGIVVHDDRETPAEPGEA